MARRLTSLLLTLLTPAVTACASSPEIMLVAQGRPVVPPVPAELLAATNGKADPPFQIEAAFALAAQMRREDAMRRDRSPAPILTASAQATSQLSRRAQAAFAPAANGAHSSAAPATTLAQQRAPTGGVQLAQVAISATAAPALPRAAIPYLELAELDAAKRAFAPAPFLAAAPPVQVAAAPAPRVSARRSATRRGEVVTVARAAVRSGSASATIARKTRVASVTASPDLGQRAVRGGSRPIVTAPVISRIRDYISRWLTSIRA